MQAIIYDQFESPLRLEDVQDPVCEKDGVLLKVHASGLCLSDWHGWMGHDKDITLPHVPGHELAGEIVEVGSEIKNFKVGDRVTVPFVSGCGHCEQCQSNNHQICDNQFQPGFTHWGSFAELVSIHYADTNLVELPTEIDFATAASLGCRFATSFRGVVDQAKTKPEDWVVVYGCGGIGLSAVMIANALGAKVLAVDIDDKKLDFAKSIGAITTLNSTNSVSVIEEIIELTDGGTNVSIDALGHPDALFHSVSSLRKRGRHIQIGILRPENVNSPIPTDLIIGRELEILGSHGMQAFRYNEMLKMIIDGQLHPNKLIEKQIRLVDIIDELPKMNQYNSVGIKVVTQF